MDTSASASLALAGVVEANLCDPAASADCIIYGRAELLVPHPDDPSQQVRMWSVCACMCVCVCIHVCGRHWDRCAGTAVRHTCVRERPPQVASSCFVAPHPPVHKPHHPFRLHRRLLLLQVWAPLCSVDVEAYPNLAGQVAQKACAMLWDYPASRSAGVFSVSSYTGAPFALPPAGACPMRELGSGLGTRQVQAGHSGNLR